MIKDRQSIEDEEFKINVWAPLSKRNVVRTLAAVPKSQLNSVLDEVETALREHWVDWGENDSKIEYLEFRDGFIYQGGRRRKPGRPCRSALRIYIRALVLIYERATGKKLRRTVGEVEVNKYTSSSKDRPIPFLVACLRLPFTYVSCGRDYPSAIVRQVLEELHGEKLAS